MSFFVGNSVIVLVVLLTLYCNAAAGAQTSCGKSFCERSNSYPVTPAIRQDMEKDPRFASLKGAPIPKISSTMGDDDPNLPPDDGQYQICKSKSDIIFPQEAQNTRGQRKFIINFGPFVQGISIERCLSDSFRLPCNFVGTPPGYQSVCVQKETEHRLTTIESDGVTGSVSTSVDIFSFPSYCACKLVKGQSQYQQIRVAGLCAPEPVPAPVIYGSVSYGADDSTNLNARTANTKLASDGDSDQRRATTQRRPALAGRSMELFGPSQSNGRFTGATPANSGWRNGFMQLP